MFTKTALCAAAVSALSTIAVAQEFTGGTLSGEYTINSGSDVMSYSGGAEFSITRQFGIGLEFTSVDSDTTAKLHGIYHLSERASVGLYYGQAIGEDSDETSIGIEGGTALGLMSVGGYLGQISDGTDSITSFGINAESPLANQFGTYFNYDYFGDSDVSFGSSELGLQYTMDQGPELYIHYGWASATAGDVTANSDFIGVGARIDFGARPGTTFGSR